MSVSPDLSVANRSSRSIEMATHRTTTPATVCCSASSPTTFAFSSVQRSSMSRSIDVGRRNGTLCQRKRSQRTYGRPLIRATRGSISDLRIRTGFRRNDSQSSKTAEQSRRSGCGASLFGNTRLKLGECLGPNSLKRLRATECIRHKRPRHCADCCLDGARVTSRSLLPCKILSKCPGRLVGRVAFFVKAAIAELG